MVRGVGVVVVVEMGKKDGWEGGENAYFYRP
jgi:hypothetical protein